MKLLYILAAFTLLSACNNKPDEETTGGDTTTTNAAEPANIGYSILNVYPHDTASFTQGLQWYNDYLYEGTGLEGESRLMKKNLKDGKAIQKIAMDDEIFGEGITILNNKIYQLTWKNKKIFVYDLATFKKLQEFHWDYDGWGITNDGKNLILSDGTDKIYFADPATLRLLNMVSVSSNYGPVGNINELEYVDGKIYANIWESDYIVKISPQTGVVEARIDFTDLLAKSGKDYAGKDVLNGIAYNAATKTFYITGKKWPALFEVKLNQ